MPDVVMFAGAVLLPPVRLVGTLLGYLLANPAMLLLSLVLVLVTVVNLGRLAALFRRRLPARAATAVALVADALADEERPRV